AFVLGARQAHQAYERRVADHVLQRRIVRRARARVRFVHAVSFARFSQSEEDAASAAPARPADALGCAAVKPARSSTELAMDLELNGKRALVTGGSRGIGKAIARALADEGCDVVIAARDRSRLDDAAAELRAATGRTILPVVVETGDDASVRAMVAQARDHLGGVDI